MSSVKQEVMVMSAARYHMVDNSTGVINEGTTVRYLFTTSLEPVAEDDLKGYKFGKTSLPYAAFGEFKDVPAVYEADLTFNIASDGIVKVRADNFVYSRPVVAAPDVKNSGK